MRTVFRWLVACTALVALNLGLVSPAFAGGGGYGPKVFTPRDPAFAATDNNGRFTAQVTYAAGRNPVAFSFVISPKLRAIATGPMACRAWQSKDGAPTGTSDNHPSIPAGYLWHWTFPVNPLRARMLASGNCVFPVQVGGRPGRADVRFTFQYVVNP